MQHLFAAIFSVEISICDFVFCSLRILISVETAKASVNTHSFDKNKTCTSQKFSFAEKIIIIYAGRRTTTNSYLSIHSSLWNCMKISSLKLHMYKARASPLRMLHPWFRLCRSKHRDREYVHSVCEKFILHPEFLFLHT